MELNQYKMKTKSSIFCYELGIKYKLHIFRLGASKPQASSYIYYSTTISSKGRSSEVRDKITSYELKDTRQKIDALDNDTILPLSMWTQLCMTERGWPLPCTLIERGCPCWYKPQSTQSAGPVRFFIFCSISIFLLARQVAGKGPQCSAGPPQQRMYSTIPIHWNIKSAPASPGRSRAGPALHVFSLLGINHLQ